MTTEIERIHAARLLDLERRVAELERQLQLATRPVLSVTEAAALLGLSRVTIYQRINQEHNPLPTRQWGNRQAVLRSDLDAWLATLPPAGERAP